MSLFTLAIAQTFIGMRGLLPELRNAPCPLRKLAFKSAKLNNLENKPIRWIVDDVYKFLKREIRRDNTYNAIILDPPSFGRGFKKEVFKIERDLTLLLDACKKLMKNPVFIALSCHTPGFTTIVLHQILEQTFLLEKGGKINSFEMKISSPSSFSLPSGSCAIWESK